MAGVLMAVVGVVAELVAPGLVEAGIEETVRSNTREVAHVEARATGSPFLPGLLLAGEIERIEITLRELVGQQLDIGTVSLRADGIRLDRGAMYRGDVEVDDIDRGRVVVELEEQELSQLLGAPVALDGGLVDLVDGALEVAAAGVGPRRVPVPDELLPCTPDLDVAPPYVRLSCTFAGVPGVLRPATED